MYLAPSEALAERFKKLHEPQAGHTLQDLLAEVEKIRGEDLRLDLLDEPPKPADKQ
jgi:hypothetical protein